MQPTPEVLARLRRLTDERIPPGGSDADTRFSDQELADILAEAATLEEAAAQVWEEKAARALSERGGLQGAALGDQRLEYVDLVAYRDHCLQMAERFRRRARGGSRVLAIEPPDVLGTSGTETGGGEWWPR